MRGYPPLVAGLVVGLLLASSPAAQDKRAFSPADLRLLEQVQLADEKFEREGLVYHDRAVDLLLTRLAQRLLEGEKPPDRVTWRVKVLRSPALNAFALPNGSIYVFSGLLASLENEDQLAAVLAHEIAHVLSRHPFARLQSSRKTTAALNITRTALAAGAVAATSPYGSSPRVVLNALTGVPGLWTVAIEGYGRDQEREADAHAARVLTRTAHDPRALHAVLGSIRRSANVEEEVEPVFWATTRRIDERMSDLGAIQLPTSDAGERPGGRSACLSDVSALVRHNARLAIDGGWARLAVADLKRLVECQADSENVYSLAEAYRALGPRTPQPDATERQDTTQRKALRELTPEERDRALSSGAAGRAAFAANRAAAEELYRRAHILDPSNHKVHRGLGFLYERAGEAEAALRAFREYLRVAPAADDRIQVERRIQQLERRGTQ